MNYKNLKILVWLLLPLTLLHWAILKLRHFFYDTGIYKSEKVDAKVISVGNITVGGTGKTPITVELAKYFATNSKPCIVLRGYKRESSGVIVASDGRNINPDKAETGDEAYILAIESNIPVICSEKRVDGALFAIDKFNCDTILLDDGFQHRHIKRDVDIVVIDSDRFLGNRLLLPFGILRDLESRLKYADIIIISKVSDVKRAKKQAKYLKRYKKPVYFSKYVYTKFISTNRKYTAEEVINSNVGLFAGIGYPENFFKNFKNVSFTKIFADHHKYTDTELEYIKNISKSCDFICATKKDFVNFSDKFNIPEKWVYPESELIFTDTDNNPINIDKIEGLL